MKKRDWSNVDWTQTNEQIAASLGGIARETVARKRAELGISTVRPKRLRLQIADMSDALRQIATASGTPANVDPLADLPGLVLAVQGVAQRAGSRDVRLAAAEGQAAVAVNEVKAFRIAFNDLARTNTQLREQAESTTAGVESRVADAVAAERMAIGAWLRARPGDQGFIARSIEHGDHIDDDAPPLPSLRMTLLLRDELNRQIKALEAEVARLRAHTEATPPEGIGGTPGSLA